MADTISMVMLLLIMDRGFCLACELFGHEFAKGSKVTLLITDHLRSTPSAVSDFKRHLERKRKKKDHDRKRTLHKDKKKDSS